MSKILTDQGFVEVGGELYHHGVLGMKWGVRRYQKSDGSRTSLGNKHRSVTDNFKTYKQRNQKAVDNYQTKYRMSKRQAKKLRKLRNIERGAKMIKSANKIAISKTNSKLAKRLYEHDTKLAQKKIDKVSGQANRIETIAKYKKSGLSAHNSKKLYNTEQKQKKYKNLQKEVRSEQKKAKTSIGKHVWDPDVKIYGSMSEHYSNKASKIRKKRRQ